MTDKRGFIGRYLRSKNIPFKYVRKQIDSVVYRHVLVSGKLFDIYFYYDNKEEAYVVKTTFNELDFEFWRSKDQYDYLDFLFELQQDKVKLDLYLKQIQDKKIQKELVNKIDNDLWNEFSKKRNFEEKVDMIKRWFDLTKEQRIRLQNEMFFDERLKKIYIDFLLNKV